MNQNILRLDLEPVPLFELRLASTHSIAKNAFEFRILLPSLPKGWGHRHTQSVWTCAFVFNSLLLCLYEYTGKEKNH